MKSRTLQFEQSLEQMKEFQKIERERLEKKIIEDKKRFELKVQALYDEFDHKHQ